MVSVAEADGLLNGLLPPPEPEQVPLDEAVGRRLWAPLIADRDGPPFDRVAMDGYAVQSEDGPGPWTVRGLQFAGAPPQDRTEPASAVEVATGAVLPRGCDAVVPYEDTRRTGGVVTLRDGIGPVQAGRHVHRQGTDYRAGDVLIPAKTDLRSPHLHSLATGGVDPVTVVRRAVWALAATGDELVEVRDQPAAWQIRRSNAAAIVGEAGAWGHRPRSQVLLPDDRNALAAGLEALLPGLDVLVVTGGVSAGAKDFVPGVLADLGVEQVFHRVAQRPGKPLWVGRRPATPGCGATVVFGLPGNPVSSLFAFRRFVLPWLEAFEGRASAPATVVLDGQPKVPDGMTVFLPWSTSEGLVEWGGSGDFSSLARTTGFVEVGDGTEVKYFPWGGSR